MDCSVYKNTMAFPAKNEYQTKFWYKDGKCVAKRGPAGELEILVPDVSVADINEGRVRTSECVVDDAAFRAARTIYGQHELSLYEAFKTDLFVELGIEDHPKREKLFARAWEDGHSAGFAEVLNCAWGLVDLIKD